MKSCLYTGIWLSNERPSLLFDVATAWLIHNKVLLPGATPLTRAICHGQRGEIHKRYREGQEDQLGALGCVTNSLVLWNTLYMQASLNYLKQHSVAISEEDDARLSHLLSKHSKMLGHYSLTLSDNVMKGKRRPLNQLSDDSP